MAADDRRRYATRRTQSQPTRRSDGRGANRPDFTRARTGRSASGRIGQSPYLERGSRGGYSMGRSRRSGLSPIPFVVAAAIALIAAVLFLRIDVTVNSVPVRTWRWATSTRASRSPSRETCSPSTAASWRRARAKSVRP